MFDQSVANPEIAWATRVSDPLPGHSAASVMTQKKGVGFLTAAKDRNRLLSR
jgi:hypothetical protein